MEVALYKYNSPCGELYIAALGNSIILCDWACNKKLTKNLARLSKAFDIEFIMPIRGAAEAIGEAKSKKNSPPSSQIILSAIKELNEYFAGERKEFSLPLTTAGTPFQKAVWRQLADIPYGKTISYSELAASISHPQAIRAAANACAANALSIMLPCHRVVSSNSSSTGYAGGATAKRLLLNLEYSKTPTTFEIKTE